jgi:signal transduction histidine kinase
VRVDRLSDNRTWLDDARTVARSFASDASGRTSDTAGIGELDMDTFDAAARQPRVVVATDEPLAPISDRPWPLHDMRVLLVVGEDLDAALVRNELDTSAAPFGTVMHTPQVGEALDRLGTERFDCVVVDLGLCAGQAGDVVRRIVTEYDVAVVALTRDAGVTDASDVIAAGAHDCLVKGRFGPDTLGRAVSVAVLRQADRRERAKLLQALRRERDRLAEVQRTARIGGWAVDPFTGDIELSREASGMFGVPASGLGDRLALLDLLHPDDHQAARTLFEGALAGMTVEGVLRLTRPSGTGRWLHVRSASQRDERGWGWGTVQDVTDQVQRDLAQCALQIRLERGQRLATLGRLAGGVAHDINNLVAVMSMGTAMARELLPAGDPAGEQLGLVADAIGRASALTSDLLVLARRDEPAASVLAVPPVLDGLSNLLRRTVGDAVHLVVTTGEHVPGVRIERTRLEQILLNLSANARDAMPRGGTLTIDVSATDDANMRIRVSDTGDGMDSETQEHAFDPFFTTKDPGRGTGLGLALVQGIVEAAGGEVELRSTAGVGTAIDVLLPAAADETSQPIPDRGRTHTTADIATILVVDDYEPIATLVSRLLMRHGHQVVTAVEPSVAAEVASSVDHLDLLVTDVVMRDRSGRDLAADLRRARPHLPVVYLSGYTADVFGGQALRDGEWFLRKPFNDVDLLDAVGRALQHSHS